MPLLQTTDRGLYCPPGNFHIDPWLPVEHALTTHAHADHARPGSTRYLASPPTAQLLTARLGDRTSVTPLPFGQTLTLNGVRLSLHPAGHLLGSAQIRIEHRGEVWVISGDYKTTPDPTCEPFEPIPCHTFITESTFGLPIYRWPPQEQVFADINAWWRTNRDANLTSVLFAYSLGKAQRILAGLDATLGPILTHGAVENINRVYRAAGITLPETIPVSEESAKEHRGQAIVIAPPSTLGSPWLRKLQPASTAFASGWMRIRGTRRRRGVDRGFVLSDHADWPSLLQTIRDTGALTVGVTHGYTRPLVRYLTEEHDLIAFTLNTRFQGELDTTDTDEPADTP